VAATSRGPPLGPDGILVDIGRAAEELKSVLAALNYRNLDDEDEFKGSNTSTEALARWVADRLAERFADEDQLSALVVTLHESHVAWASYERSLSTPPSSSPPPLRSSDEQLVGDPGEDV
jgi:6-pyruvoyl-tetrahydropterin synthase